MKIIDLQKKNLKMRVLKGNELSSGQKSSRKKSLLIERNYEHQNIEQQKMSETPLKQIYLQVNTELNELNSVLQWFNQLEPLLISKTVLCQCQLVLAEGFTNAVRHAHKDLPLETPIKLQIIVFQDRLEMRIWDYGQPFDLEGKLNEFEKIDHERLDREGERGLIIMRRSADRLSYTRSFDEQNCLLFVKHLLSC